MESQVIPIADLSAILPELPEVPAASETSKRKLPEGGKFLGVNAPKSVDKFGEELPKSAKYLLAADEYRRIVLDRSTSNPVIIRHGDTCYLLHASANNGGRYVLGMVELPDDTPVIVPFAPEDHDKTYLLGGYDTVEALAAYCERMGLPGASSIKTAVLTTTKTPVEIASLSESAQKLLKYRVTSYLSDTGFKAILPESEFLARILALPERERECIYSSKPTERDWGKRKMLAIAQTMQSELLAKPIIDGAPAEKLPDIRPEAPKKR